MTTRKASATATAKATAEGIGIQKKRQPFRLPLLSMLG
jgi:hypothetical protein